MNKEKDVKMQDFHIPRWSELPTIDLYLDQVVLLINSYLSPYIYKDEESNILTKTMINNYVKNDLIEAPIKKQYGKTQLAKLFVICVLKQVYSMNEIQNLIQIAITNSTLEKAYDKFCNLFEEALERTFEKRDFKVSNSASDSLYLLKTVLLSCSYKIYVQSIINAEKNSHK